MFASVKNLALGALYLGAHAQAAAVPTVSEDVMAAFNITAADLVQPRAEQMGSASLIARVASCAPPTTPNDSTYGACVLPLSNEARQGNAISMLALAEYMTKQMGCPLDGIHGQASRPVVKIVAYRCTSAGPAGTVDTAVPGWSINAAFNPKACPPGSKCY